MSVTSKGSEASVGKQEELNEVPDDPRVTILEKLKMFLSIYWRGLVIIVAPLMLIPMLTPFPPEKYQWCAYTLMLMAFYWVTECIPLPVTSFLPVLIFPFAGVMDTGKTCQCYMNNTIVMFLGSMMLAAAVEQSGLHKRLALYTIRAFGFSHYKLLFAVSFITMFVSMWITNTAATTMMVPIVFALLKVLEEQNALQMYERNKSGDLVATDLSTCYFCAITFSATIGGIGTLVGTATNLVFKGLFVRAFPDAPEYLSFPKFSAFSVPYMLLMEISMYLYLIIVYFGFLRPNSNAAKESVITSESAAIAKETVDQEWKNLGKVTFWEIMVIILFGGAMFLFFSRSPQIFLGWGDRIIDHFGIENKRFIGDSVPAMLVCTLMLLLFSNLDFFKNFTAKTYEEMPNGPVPSVLGWTLMNNALPYSFMFLLGGGFALSEAAKKQYTDLNGRISDMLQNLKDLPNSFIIFLIIIFTIFVTNFASNVVVCNIITPIVMQLALTVKVNPLWYNISAGFSASYCFCLPVGTPGNLIVQGAADIPTTKMIIAGAGPTVSTLILTWIAIYLWAPVIWPDLHEYPSWTDA